MSSWFKLESVKIDDSIAYKIKRETLESLGYLSEDRWEVYGKQGNENIVWVLGDEKDYLNMLLADKDQTTEIKTEKDIITRVTGQPAKTSVVTQLFKGRQSNILFSSVSSITYTIDPQSDRQTLAPDWVPFVSVYALPTTEEWMKTGSNQKYLKFVQLTRYDPIEQSDHLNDLSCKSQEQQDAYSYYFCDIAPAPHFHFACLEDAKNHGNATRNAINLFKLLEYIVDLKNGKDLARVCDFNMPYLKISENPNLYKTAYSKEAITILKNFWKMLKDKNYDTEKIKDAIDSVDLSVNLLINKERQSGQTKRDRLKKTFGSLINSVNQKTIQNGDVVLLTGLDAVTMDVLCLLFGYCYSRGYKLSDQFSLAVKTMSGGGVKVYTASSTASAQTELERSLYGE